MFRWDTLTVGNCNYMAYKCLIPFVAALTFSESVFLDRTVTVDAKIAVAQSNLVLTILFMSQAGFSFQDRRHLLPR